MEVGVRDELLFRKERHLSVFVGRLGCWLGLMQSKWNQCLVDGAVGRSKQTHSPRGKARQQSTQ